MWQNDRLTELPDLSKSTRQIGRLQEVNYIGAFEELEPPVNLICHAPGTVTAETPQLSAAGTGPLVRAVAKYELRSLAPRGRGPMKQLGHELGRGNLIGDLRFIYTDE